jgi:hypothetical protein
MNERKYEWCEVWIDTSLDPVYVLVLSHRGGADGYDLYDPTEKKIIEQFGTYEEANYWRSEEAYDLAEGRMII